MEYIPKKKVVFNVQCPGDPAHIFQRVFELELDREEPDKDIKVDALCPYCTKIVDVTVIGKTPLDEEMLKRFVEQDQRRGRKKTPGQD